jgi:hypothetical protein
MLATVHVLHPPPSVIGGFLRVGHTGHRKLAALHAAGKLFRGLARPRRERVLARTSSLSKIYTRWDGH